MLDLIFFLLPLVIAGVVLGILFHLTLRGHTPAEVEELMVQMGLRRRER